MPTTRRSRPMTAPQAPAGQLKVAIIDDVVAARAEQFHIPGLEVTVFAHADGAALECVRDGFDVIFMDHALGAGHQDGEAMTAELRAAGFTGRIVAISSDPAANAAIRAAGADDALASKALLRSYLVHLGATHTRGG
jgi:DNA-binding NarL/FixJ family response regulator